MSTATYANSRTEVIVSLRWKDPLDAEIFSEHEQDLLKEGVYKVNSTELLTKISNTSVQVNLFSSIVKNPSKSVIESTTLLAVVRDIFTKIDTRTSKTLTGIDYTTPYIVLEFDYSQSISVVPSVKNVAYTAIDYTKQIVLGKCLYRDNVGTKDELYGFDTRNVTQKSVIGQSDDFLKEFTVVPVGDYSLQVRGGMLEGTILDDILVGVGSVTGMDFDIPIPSAGKHRYYLVYVDTYNTFQVIAGTEENDATGDEYPKPAKTFPSGTSVLGLDGFEFPVCLIYVNYNHNTRIVELADVENITPRFSKKSLLFSQSSTLNIINTQLLFNAFFGLDATPGEVMYKDITNLNVQIYPSETAGSDGQYDLYNYLVIKATNSQINSFGISYIKYTNAQAGIKFIAETEVNPSYVEYSNVYVNEDENKYVDTLPGTGQPLVGDYKAIEVGDIVSIISSDTPLNNIAEATVTSVVKGVNGRDAVLNTFDVKNIASSKKGYCVYNGDLYTAYGAATNSLYFTKFKYNTSNKAYEIDTAFGTAGTKTVATGLGFEPTTVRVDVNALEAAIVYWDATDVEFVGYYSKDLFDTVEGGGKANIVAGSTVLDNQFETYEIKLGVERLYIAGFFNSTKRVYYAICDWDSGSADWEHGNSSGFPYLSTSSTTNQQIGLIIDPSDITKCFISFSNGDLKTRHGVRSDTSSQSADGTISTTRGIYSTLLYDGTNIRIFYSFDSATETSKATYYGTVHLTTAAIIEVGVVNNRRGLISAIYNTDNQFGEEDLLSVGVSVESREIALKTTGLTTSVWPSSVVDKNNIIHIIYKNSSDNLELMSSTENGGWGASSVIYSGADVAPVGISMKLAVDNKNYLHAAFSEVLAGASATYGLMYGNNKSGSWTWWQLDGIASTQSAGLDPNIFIDKNDFVHISHSRYSASYTTVGGLTYTTNKSGRWVNTIVNISNDTGFQSKIFVDDEGFVDIFYLNASTGTYQYYEYVTNRSGLWLPTTIYSVPATFLGYSGSVVKDKYGFYHCAYLDFTNKDLIYSNNVTGSWSTVTIDSTGDTGLWPSLKISSKGNLYIAYIKDTSPNEGKLAVNTTGTPLTGGSWVLSTIVTAGGDATGPTYIDLTIDKDDNLHAFYDASTNLGLYYWANYHLISNSLASTISWNTSRVPYTSSEQFIVNGNNDYIYSLDYQATAAGNFIQQLNYNSKIGIDYTKLQKERDSLFLLNLPNKGNDLKIKINENNQGFYKKTPVLSAIDAVTNRGKYSSLKVDKNNNLHVIYKDVTNSRLVYATNKSGYWVTEPLLVSTSNVDTSFNLSWAFDSNESIHIAYYEGSTGTGLEYVTNKSGTWVLSELDSGYGEYPSLAIDSKDFVHIIYGEESSTTVRYATNKSGAWILSSPETTTAMRYLSLVIDSNDYLHFSCKAPINDGIYYASDTSGSWEFHYLYAPPNARTFLSIDDKDGLHLIAGDDTNDRIFYSYNSGNDDWVTKTIYSAALTIGNEVPFSSVVDKNGVVHVAVSTDTAGSLLYLTNKSGAWVSSVLTTYAGDVVYPSIAVDKKERVYVSWYDSTAQTLKLYTIEYIDDDLITQNTVTSNLDLTFKNTSNRNELEGFSSTVNNTFKVTSINCSSKGSIKEVNNSTLEVYLDNKDNTWKNFVDCKNVTLNGMVNGEAMVGAGDFNE